jgi:bifunctional isochorismate lyase/aryl carrier protein
MKEKDGAERPGHAAHLREAYARPEDMDARALEWMAALRPCARHAFRPDRLGSRPALLVLDMQRFFLEEEAPGYLPAGAAVLPRVRALAEAFRARGLPLVFTRHVDRPPGDEGSMSRWWGRSMRADDPRLDLHPQVDCRPRDLVLLKHQYSAFCGTRLEALLEQLHASSVVVCGVMTHLCCDTTARDAFMRGYEVVASVDAMATLSEELHLASLRCLVHGFALPALAKEVLCGIQA